jgi:1,4-dihydroxy-2-naphthoyl-CoA hydrolase
MYQIELKLRMAHTDCAGVIFFPRLLELAHECWESFLSDYGVDLWQKISSDDPMLPIVHCEADYRRPMRLGDSFTIQLRVTQIGERSFELAYLFLDPKGKELAGAKTVHAALDKKTGQSLPLWPDLIMMLQSLVDQG